MASCEIQREVTPEKVKDTSSYIFVVDGEVLHKGELFEHFRYRFTLPSTQAKPESSDGTQM